MMRLRFEPRQLDSRAQAMRALEDEALGACGQGSDTTTGPHPPGLCSPLTGAAPADLHRPLSLTYAHGLPADLSGPPLHSLTRANSQQHETSRRVTSAKDTRRGCHGGLWASWGFIFACWSGALLISPFWGEDFWFRVFFPLRLTGSWR